MLLVGHRPGQAGLVVSRVVRGDDGAAHPVAQAVESLGSCLDDRHWGAPEIAVNDAQARVGALRPGCGEVAGLRSTRSRLAFARGHVHTRRGWAAAQLGSTCVAGSSSTGTASGSNATCPAVRAGFCSPTWS